MNMQRNLVASFRKGDTDGVGRSLVETARSAGSDDNITAVVVFLRPVSVLMEEETARISQGQVPEAESFVLAQKDAPPPSFNAIFSPPENFNSTMNPSPAEVSIPKEENGMLAKANEEPALSPAVENVESPSQDYDSDEGVGIDITVEKNKNDVLETDGNPTDEEVDAALAELDSIPDGGCEAGEVEDEEDEEEEWSYFKMEPQHQQVQSEDFIVPAVDKVPLECEPSHELNEDQVIVKEKTSPSTPPAPSSPRTVEGFVTSVELNTPEESYNTSLAINQSTEYFNGGQIEQNSGPFSVYVSSSPEPASIETSPVNLHSPILSSNPLLPEIVEKLQGEEIMEVQSPGASVEIVHAQSTVEVMSDSPIEVDIPSPLQDNPLIENISPIPDIMTQSFTGENLPTEPYADDQAHIDQLQKSLGNIYEEENKENVNILDQLSPQQNEPINDSKFETDVTPLGDCSFIQTVEAVSQLQTTTSLENRTETASMEVIQNVSSQEFSPSFTSYNAENLVVDIDTHHELNESEQITYEAEASDSQAHFAEKINKAFEEPLDHMTSSFHEDTNILLDMSPAPEVPLVEIETDAEQELMEPVPDAAAIQELSDKLSEIEVEEKEVLPAPEAAVTTDLKTPTSAPRTSVNKSAPPKPSPRSIDSKASGKVSGSSLNATSTTKRPSSLIAAPKLQKKTEPPKVPSTTTTKSRLATATSRLSSQPQRLTTSRPQSAAPKPKPTSMSLTKPKTSLSQTGPSSAPKTTTTLTSKTRPISSTSTTTARSRLSNTPATTGAKRVPSATKSLTSTTTTTTTATRTVKSSGIPNGVSQGTKTTKTTTNSKTSLSTTRRPLTAKTTTSTTTATTRPVSAPSSNRSLASSTKSSTSALKQRSTTTSSPSTKETKNTTNRLLSTSRTTTGTSKSLVAAKSTTTQLKSKVASKMTKTTGLKSKKEVEKSIVKNTDSAIANGENKIIEEESTVEVKEKLVQEEEVVLRSEVVSETLVEKTEETVTSATETILVNGDH
ncbi:hypothetical protein Anas_02686 [Armadillidium nasatum]|uniref:Uncharacterized protein n=1 Tax=Armadillidium nasatum TaxID=96803 RepID=A0A5N5SX50_9CRUS|nr:hypothetical protein Anas_02686 [Armadillidium nasatum]